MVRTVSISHDRVLRYAVLIAVVQHVSAYIEIFIIWRVENKAGKLSCASQQTIFIVFSCFLDLKFESVD
jgi:hypothetical protein